MCFKGATSMLGALSGINDFREWGFSPNDYFCRTILNVSRPHRRLAVTCLCKARWKLFYVETDWGFSSGPRVKRRCCPSHLLPISRWWMCWVESHSFAIVFRECNRLNGKVFDDENDTLLTSTDSMNPDFIRCQKLVHHRSNSPSDFPLAPNKLRSS